YVAAEIAETGSAEIGVDGALSRVELWRCGEFGWIQVAVEAAADSTAGQSASNGAAGRELTGQRGWSRAKTQEGASTARVGDGKGRTGLDDGDAAYRPTAQERSLNTSFRSKEWQVIPVAGNETM